MHPGRIQDHPGRIRDVTYVFILPGGVGSNIGTMPLQKFGPGDTPGGAVSGTLSRDIWHGLAPKPF